MVFCTISAIFAHGPLVMSTILSASRIASSTSWVIMNTVCWVSAQMRSTSSCSMPRVSASRALNGSSISSILGWIDRARAMPTRCFMPPESCAGRLASAPLSPTRSMNLRAWSCTLARSHDGQRERPAKAMLPMTVSPGSTAGAGAAYLAVVDDPVALARPVEPGQHVQDRGLAAAGMADQADELAAIDAEPQVLEHRRVAKAARQAFDADQRTVLHGAIPD